MSQTVMSQVIAGQTIISYVIGGEETRLLRGRENDKLIGKKPPNPVKTKEENQGRKVFVIV